MANSPSGTGFSADRFLVGDGQTGNQKKLAKIGDRVKNSPPHVCLTVAAFSRQVAQGRVLAF